MPRSKPLALTFNTVAARYDRYRPLYPAAVFDAICAYQPLDAEAHLLEIGLGTGQATQPFLQRDYRVTAVDPGDQLTAFAQQALAEYPGFAVHTCTFEDFATSDQFDLIYAATSFHWVDPAIGFTKIRNLLRPGGTVALFWNHPEPQDPAHAAMQLAYELYRPTRAAKSRTSFSAADAAPRAQALIAAGFQDVHTTLHTSTRSLTAAAYIQLLNTYSDHLAMADTERLALEQAVTDAIDAHGGTITIKNVADLHLARTPIR